jgi:hypothetical protein
MGNWVPVDRRVFEGLDMGLEALTTLVRGVDTERELPLGVIEDAEREGPSLEATRADLSRKRLNSYFAVDFGMNRLGESRNGCLTPDIYFYFTVPFCIFHVRRRWMPYLIGVVDSV